MTEFKKFKVTFILFYNVVCLLAAAFVLDMWFIYAAQFLEPNQHISWQIMMNHCPWFIWPALGVPLGLAISQLFIPWKLLDQSPTTTRDDE